MVSTPAPHIKPVGLETRVCRHLHGDSFKEYILRTQTRTLGGISLEFRARAIRQLFPYKPFASLSTHKATVTDSESDAESADDKIVVKHEVPSNGNKKTKQTQWTAAELRVHDEHMMAYAQWEVDYAGKFVLSRRCERTTQNGSSVCDECALISKNTSFKEAVRRVSVVLQMSSRYS